jgi:NADH-quinone oxidoreductase subunit N
MIALFENFHVALPEAIILLAAVVALVVDLFVRHRCQTMVLFIACIGLFATALVSALHLGQFSELFFHGLLISDDLAHLMICFIAVTVFLGFIYSRHYLQDRGMSLGDYYVLGLFSTLGMLVMVSAHSLLSLYLGLELMSLPLYAMTAMNRQNADATEAAMKYFVMGAIASGMLLYGMALIYGATGQLDVQAIAEQLSTLSQQSNLMLIFAMVFVLAGVGFKLAAVPFHFWAPDVYQGAPNIVTLFISTAPKIAAVGMLFRVLSMGFVEVHVEWQHMILAMAILSAGFGNLVAVVQTSLKRLLAYSAIAQIGFVLFALVVATPEGNAAALYYILVYALISAAAFGLLVLMSTQGLEIDNLEDLKGLNKRSPWLAFMMLIVMFSLAGVPPTVGFFIKFLVLKALIDAHLTWVAVLGLLFTVIGAYYYIRIIKLMYFDAPSDEAPIAVSKGKALVYSINCMSLLYLGLFPSALITLCVNAFAP